MSDLSKRGRLPDRLSNLTIEYRSPASLKPDPRNSRTHPKKQVDQIVASIAKFGFASPVLVDEASVIIAGHGRLLAATKLGLTEIPVIELKGLSEVEKRALRLAENKIAQNAGWDLDLLRGELLAIAEPELKFDMELTGFSIAEIDLVIRGAGASDPDDEVVPAVAQAPVTRRGDVWVLDGHRVMCGDTRDRGHLAKLMLEHAAQAAFLDPPYNIKIDGNAVGRGRHREFAMASGEMTAQQFTAFLIGTLGACASVSEEGGVHFVCMDHHHVAELSAAGDKVYGSRLNICVWKKSNAGMGGLYRSQHELVFVFKVGEGPHRNNVELGRHGRNRTNVWDYASVNSLKGSRRQDLALHPTVKPVAMVADAILDVTRRGDIVLDGFLGSGTSLLAAERVGRRCFGMEYEPLYVDLALKRWRDLTGHEPTLEATGEAFSVVEAKRQAEGQDHG